MYKNDASFSNSGKHLPHGLGTEAYVYGWAGPVLAMVVWIFCFKLDAYKHFKGGNSCLAL